MAKPPTEFLEHVQRITEFPTSLSEADTRAYLVDPLLQILGYREFGDIRREVSVPATKEHLDYELRAGGQAQAIVEAKALRHAVGDQHAAQCVQYASVLGIRWCIITNGIAWAVYDAHAKGPLPQKKVAEVRLEGDEAEINKAWSVLSLFSRGSLSQEAPLIGLLADRVVADELSRPDSPAVTALRRGVRRRFGEQVSGQAIIDAVRRLKGESADDEAVRQDSIREPATPPSGRVRQKQASSAIAALVEGGLLPADAEVDCKLYGITHSARLRDGRIELNGRLYDTPSAAAAALRGGKASNGWVIWRYRGELLASLREKLQHGEESS